MRIILPLAIGVLLAACGDDGGAKAHDAGPIDGATQIEAAPDAPPLPVTLTITGAGGSAAMGIQVFFQNVDSSVVKSTTTDAGGSASAVMVAGGYVTAMVPSAAPVGAFQPLQIETFAGVKPGDHLTLGAPTDVVSQEVAFTAETNNAAGFGSGSNVQYTVHTTCDEVDPTSGAPDLGATLSNGGSNTEIGGATLPSTCTNANISVWAVTTTGVAVATATSVTIGSTVDLTATAYVAPNAVVVSYTDVPANIDGLGVDQSLHTLAGTLSPALTNPGMAVTAGSASGTLYQTTLAGSKAVTATEPQFSGSAFGAQEILELGAVGSAYTLDVGANVLHEWATAPAYTITSHSVDWTEGATGVAPDLVVVAIGVKRGADLWAWAMASPRNNTTAAFPVLPAGTFNYNPAVGDTVGLANVDEYKLPGGYDALRAFIFSNVDPVVALGTAGKGSHEALIPPADVGSKHHAVSHWFAPPTSAKLRQ